MATAKHQRQWRNNNKSTKSQLNIMARRVTHDDLNYLANHMKLRGKGEAVAFACYVTKCLIQFAEQDMYARQLVGTINDSYGRNRDLYK